MINLALSSQTPQNPNSATSNLNGDQCMLAPNATRAKFYQLQADAIMAQEWA